MEISQKDLKKIKLGASIIYKGNHGEIEVSKCTGGMITVTLKEYTLEAAARFVNAIEPEDMD